MDYRYRKYRAVIAACIISIIAMVIGASAFMVISQPVKQTAAGSTVTELTPEPTLIVTPSPIPTLAESYEDWKFRNGGYSLGQSFTWRRDDVSGLKARLMHATVYG